MPQLLCLRYVRKHLLHPSCALQLLRERASMIPEQLLTSRVSLQSYAQGLGQPAEASKVPAM